MASHLESKNKQYELDAPHLTHIESSNKMLAEAFSQPIIKSSLPTSEKIESAISSAKQDHQPSQITAPYDTCDTQVTASPLKTHIVDMPKTQQKATEFIQLSSIRPMPAVSNAHLAITTPERTFPATNAVAHPVQPGAELTRTPKTIAEASSSVTASMRHRDAKEKSQQYEHEFDHAQCAAASKSDEKKSDGHAQQISNAKAPIFSSFESMSKTSIAGSTTAVPNKLTEPQSTESKNAAPKHQQEPSKSNETPVKITTFADPLQRRNPQLDITYSVRASESKQSIDKPTTSNSSNGLSWQTQESGRSDLLTVKHARDFATTPDRFISKSEPAHENKPPIPQIRNTDIVKLVSQENNNNDTPLYMPSDLIGLRGLRSNVDRSGPMEVDDGDKNAGSNRFGEQHETKTRQFMADAIESWQTGKLPPNGSASRHQLIEELRRTEPKQLDQIKEFLMSGGRSKIQSSEGQGENILAAAQRIIKALAADLRISCAISFVIANRHEATASEKLSTKDNAPRLDVNLAAQLKDRNVVKFLIRVITEWQSGKLVPNGEPVRRQLLETLRQLGTCNVQQLKQELANCRNRSIPSFKNADATTMESFRKALLALLADGAKKSTAPLGEARTSAQVQRPKEIDKTASSPKSPEQQLPMVACPTCGRITQLGAVICPICKVAMPASDMQNAIAAAVKGEPIAKMPPEQIYVREPGQRQSA